MYYKSSRALLSIIIISLISCCSISAEEIKIATIKDLTPVLQEIKNAFEKENPDDFVNVIITKKDEIETILDKTPDNIDIIFIDNLKFLEKLSTKKYIYPESINKIAKDYLCITVKKGTPMRSYMLYPETPVMKGVIVSNPNYTSCGEYTKQYLKKLNLWDKMNKKLVFFETITSITEAVSMGQYDGGITYCSFAKKSSNNISDILNPNYYSPIIYASGINIKQKPESTSYKFNAFLKSKIVKNILNKHYFSF